jgi:hypothetical protein
MAYKITIPKHGKNAGEVTIESLDSTSCNVVQEVSQHYGTIKNMTLINHGDDVPLFDSVHVTE